MIRQGIERTWSVLVDDKSHLELLVLVLVLVLFRNEEGGFGCSCFDASHTVRRAIMPRLEIDRSRRQLEVSELSFRLLTNIRILQ